MRADKTVIYYNGDEEAFMFRAPPLPLHSHLSGADQKFETFLCTLQNEVGAAAHAVLSGNELAGRLFNEVQACKQKLEDNGPEASDRATIISLLENTGKFLDTHLSKRYGNATRILSSSFNRLTEERRRLLSNNNFFYRAANESKEVPVPPSERHLFGAMALHRYKSSKSEPDDSPSSTPSAAKNKGGGGNSQSKSSSNSQRSTQQSRHHSNHSNQSRPRQHNSSQQHSNRGNNHSQHGQQSYHNSSKNAPRRGNLGGRGGRSQSSCK